jgi:hypothetical protein
MIELDFQSYILDQPAITALVGNRVYHNQVPQSPDGAEACYPAITLPVSSKSWEWTQDGTNSNCKAVFSMVCMTYGEPEQAYEDCKRLTYAIRRAINNYSGIMGDTQVIDCSVMDEADGVQLWQQGYANCIQPITLRTEIWFVDNTNT